MPSYKLKDSTKEKKTFWQFALSWWNGRCAYCLKEAHWLSKDHLFPKNGRNPIAEGRSRHGPNHKFNLVPSCGECNTRKGNEDPREWCTEQQLVHIERYFRHLLLHCTQCMMIDKFRGDFDQYKARTLKQWISTAEWLQARHRVPQPKRIKHESIPQEAPTQTCRPPQLTQARPYYFRLWNVGDIRAVH